MFEIQLENCVGKSPCIVLKQCEDDPADNCPLVEADCTLGSLCCTCRTDPYTWYDGDEFELEVTWINDNFVYSNPEARTRLYKMTLDDGCVDVPELEDNSLTINAGPFNVEAGGTVAIPLESITPDFGGDDPLVDDTVL